MFNIQCLYHIESVTVVNIKMLHLQYLSLLSCCIPVNIYLIVIRCKHTLSQCILYLILHCGTISKIICNTYATQLKSDKDTFVNGVLTHARKHPNKDQFNFFSHLAIMGHIYLYCCFIVASLYAHILAQV